MLHTKNQLPSLSQSDLKCNETRVVVLWFVVFLTNNNTTPTKVVLSCFGFLVGL
jgi:hypothetical protein